MQLDHPNLMQPEQVISAFNWYLIVLPELVTLNFSLDPKSVVLRKLPDMSYDLANGLQFLHDSGIAHMDIKPNNLVYHPRTFVLQIIDFNLAVWVEDPDQTLLGHRGTLFWMAPGL